MDVRRLTGAPDGRGKPVARKLTKKSAEALNRLCMGVALILAAVTYCLIPLDGRGPIGIATLAAGALAYGATRYTAMRVYGAVSRPAARTRTAK